MTQQRVVLDEDDIRRTLVRIAHEIVEKNADGDVALVGIHRRGAHLATRLHRLVCDLLEAEVPHGEIDIAFYRDDIATRPNASPVVHASDLPFRLEEHTVVLIDDVLFTGRTVRPVKRTSSMSTTVCSSSRNGRSEACTTGLALGRVAMSSR